MINSFENKRFPVEYLVFQLENSDCVDEFIKKDHEIWTEYLSSFKGFISKEVWLNEEKPGEIHTILIWENLDCWKSIPLEDLKSKDVEFKIDFTSGFEIVRRVHKEYNHGLFKVKHFQKECLD